MGKVIQLSTIRRCLVLALTICGLEAVQGIDCNQLGPFPILGEFFDEIRHDLTSLTWNHEIRNEEEMKWAFKRDETMLVVDAYISNQFEPLNFVPVIGSPDSSLTFQNFIQDFTNYNIESNKTFQKGLRVQFPNLEAVDPTLRILKFHEGAIQFPVIVHGDVLKGPGSFCNSVSQNSPLDPERFIQLTQELLPQASLSLGWVTGSINWPKTDSTATMMYTEEHVSDMLNIIEKTGLNATKMDLTISVRSPFVVGGKVEGDFVVLLRKLGPYGSLTLSALKEDPVWIKATTKFISMIGKSRVYADFEDSWYRRLALGLDIYSPQLYYLDNYRSARRDYSSDKYRGSGFMALFPMILVIIILSQCFCVD